MSISKTEVVVSKQLPAPIERAIQSFIPNSPDMPLKQMAKLTRVSKHYHAWFQPILNDAREALPLLRSVAHTDCKTLIQQVLKNPELFFKKGQITDADGQTFYNVSPYQLMVFLCDKDMSDQVMPLLPETFNEKIGNRVVTTETTTRRQRQYAELGLSGGADLVRMDRNPTKVKFEEITRFKAHYRDTSIQQYDAIFPLLENPDGIIFYQDERKKIHLFYANKSNQTVTQIKLSKEQRQALASLFTSFMTMELNSSRRSSNEEHSLIAHTLGHTLSRQGILYTQNGISYRDNRMQFRLTNAIRACYRLANDDTKRADALWISGVGRAQRQVLWLLARICESKRPFDPLPNFSASPFQREFIFFNSSTGTNETVFAEGRLADGLGSHFALKKDRERILWEHSGKRALVLATPGVSGSTPYLIAVNRLIENAKASFRLEKEMAWSKEASSHSPGPG